LAVYSFLFQDSIEAVEDENLHGEENYQQKKNFPENEIS
jgi:hypothetical protein